MSVKMRVSRLIVSVSTASTGQLRPAHAWCRDGSDRILSAHASRASAVVMSRKTFSDIHGLLILSTEMVLSFSRKTVLMSRAGFGGFGGFGALGFATRGF